MSLLIPALRKKIRARLQLRSGRDVPARKRLQLLLGLAHERLEEREVAEGTQPRARVDVYWIPALVHFYVGQHAPFKCQFCQCAVLLQRLHQRFRDAHVQAVVDASGGDVEVGIVGREYDG